MAFLGIQRPSRPVVSVWQIKTPEWTASSSLFPGLTPTASDTISPILGTLSSLSFEDSLSRFSSHLSRCYLVSFTGSFFPCQREFSRIPAPASALPPQLLSLVTVFFFFFSILIYLAALGLSCGMQDL